VGIIGCDFEADSLYETLRKEAIQQVILGAASLLLGLVLLFILLNMIFNPLREVNNILNEIAAGEGDLTRRINLNRRDEIGELAKNFNLTLEKIRSMVIIIQRQCGQLFKVGNELISNMDETASSMNEITTNIQSIQDQVNNQSASVTETGATMEQITGNIGKLNDHIENQSASVSQSSSAIEQMVANIQSVTRTLARNMQNVDTLTRSAEVGRTGFAAVSSDLQDIAKESVSLLEINTVMQDIASQTGLLAMNAAIEAAHAGESGRGFSVVADEVRKLAENSQGQSRTIAGVLQKIKSAIDNITLSAESVMEEFKTIDQGIRVVSEQELEIRRAMEEQGQGSQQILEALGKLNSITHLVEQGSAEMQEGSREVIHESKNLGVVTGEITRRINEIATGADLINTAVNRVHFVSTANKEHIDALMTAVSKFKIE
jgi:methyl-accepting chemotaxis protein